MLASPLERFVEAHQERLIRLACLVTGNTADAADAVAHALDESWRRQAKLGDESRLRVALDQLAVREAVRLANRPALLSLVSRGSGISWIEPVDPDGPNGRDTAEWSDVQAAYEKLPTEQRAAVALHFYAAYTVEEVADLVDAPTEIARARLRLATDSVRAELSELASYRPRRDRNPDDDCDTQLSRFLHWRAEHLRGLPTAGQLAARVAEAPARRRARRGPRLFWAAAGLATVLVGVFLFAPEPSQPSPAVAAASPTAVPTFASNTPRPVEPTLAPTATPAADLAACAANRVQIDGPGHPLPAAAVGLVAPKGTELATVVQSNAYSGDIVVAGDTPGSAAVIGSFSGARHGYRVRATIWAASDASGVLVELNQTGAGPDATALCGNLFLVRGYGATAITDNGPGSTLDHAALLLSSAGQGVFYLSGTSLHNVSADDQDRSFDLAGCEWQPQLTALSPGGDSLAFECVRFPGADVLTYNVGIVDLLSGVGTFTQLERANLPSIGMVWTGERSLLAAVAERTASPTDNGPILLRDGTVGPNGVSFTSRVETTYRTDWVVPAARFSPDGNWLLSVGDAYDSPEPYHTFLIDTHTGATTQLPWPVVDVAAPTLAFPIWLPGTRPRVVMWQDEHLYRVDLLAGTRTDLGAIPRVGDEPNVNFAVVPIPVGLGG